MNNNKLVSQPECQNSTSQTLIVDNLSLVNSVVRRRFSNYRCWAEELTAAGLEGLYDAAERFDPERGKRFRAFASKCIYNACVSQIRRLRLASLPQSAYKMFKSLERAKNDLIQCGVQPSLEDICKKAGVELETAMKMLLNYPTVMTFSEQVFKEIDQEAVELGDTLAAYEPTPSGICLNKERGKKLKTLLNCLSREEREVVELKYALQGDRSISNAEIGRSIGKTGQGVGKILQRALCKMREAAQKDQFWHDEIENRKVAS